MIYGCISAAVIFSVINKYGISADTLFLAALLLVLLYMSVKDAKEKKVPGGALAACALLCCARTVIVYGVMVQTAVSAAAAGAILRADSGAFFDVVAEFIKAVLREDSVRLHGADLSFNAAGLFAELKSAAAGAAAVLILLVFAVFLCEFLLKRKLMGGADIKIFVLLGAWFGARAGIMIILLACLFALPSAVSGILFQPGSGSFPENKKGTFAFVPAIFLAVWTAVIFF